MRYLEYGYSLIKVLLLRVKYNNRATIHWQQLFNPSTKIIVKGKGSITLGRITRTRRNCTFLCTDGDLKIGKGLFMNQNAMITCAYSIKIGNNVTIANNVVIVDHDHNYKNATSEQFVTEEVTIGDNTWIGANSVILRGAKIGHDCVIAAGTVVRKGNYLPFSIIYNKQDLNCRQYVK